MEATRSPKHLPRNPHRLGVIFFPVGLDRSIGKSPGELGADGKRAVGLFGAVDDPADERHRRRGVGPAGEANDEAGVGFDLAIDDQAQTARGEIAQLDFFRLADLAVLHHADVQLQADFEALGAAIVLAGALAVIQHLDQVDRLDVFAIHESHDNSFSRGTSAGERPG